MASTGIFPAVAGRDQELNLNLNTTLGELSAQRIPFAIVKTFLSKLSNSKIKLDEKEGLIDMKDILSDPNVINRLVYFVPNSDSNIVNSSIFAVLNLSLSDIVNRDIKVYNIYQGEKILPASSKTPNIIRKASIAMCIKHEFKYTNVEATIAISGVANKKLYELTNDFNNFSLLPGIPLTEHVQLKALTDKKMTLIAQYLASELSTIQLSLEKGILLKCIQISKAHCINRPLARIVNRHHQDIKNWNISNVMAKQNNLSLIMKEMANQTNVAIFELEHDRHNFLSKLIDDFLNPKIISRSITKDSPFMIKGKPIRGIIFMPQDCLSFLSKNISLQNDVMECDGKNIYFKPDDIFKKVTDKNIVEILHKEDVNSYKSQTDHIDIGNILNGSKKDQLGTIVKLTEAGKKLLDSINNQDGFNNSLLGDRKDYVIASTKVRKKVTYYEHANQVFVIEELPVDDAHDTNSQWLMSTHIKYMGLVIWGGVNLKSSYLQSYGTLLENEIIGNDRNLHVPDKLFSVKPVKVKHSTLNVPDLTFDVNEAIKVLTNPMRFTNKQVLSAINETYSRVKLVGANNTKFIQSIFKKISEACINHRKFYKHYISLIGIDDKYPSCDSILDSLARIELKELFSLHQKPSESDYNDNTFYMTYRYLSGSIPWFICGGRIGKVLQGNRLISVMKSNSYWKDIKDAIRNCYSFLENKPEFNLSYKECFNNDEYGDDKDENIIINTTAKLKEAGFLDFDSNSIDDDELFKEWYDTSSTDLKEVWKKETTTPLDNKDFISHLLNIAKSLKSMYMALFQNGDEYQLNYLFTKNKPNHTLWHIVSHVVLPTLTKGRIKFQGDTVIVNTNLSSLYDNMLLYDKDIYNAKGLVKDYVLSCNVSKMAMLTDFSELIRMSSIFMMFNYNSPAVIKQMVTMGIHTGFSILYARGEQTPAADIMILEPDSISLIQSPGKNDVTSMHSDGETIASTTCHMQYAPNTLGPAGLIAQSVFPIPFIDNKDRDSSGKPKISSDFITRNYIKSKLITDDIFFTFDDKNRNIITENYSDITMDAALPYKQSNETKRDYVPIISPLVFLEDDMQNYPILGLERCPDSSASGGYSAYHQFFNHHKPSASRNVYMSNLFSEGHVRYANDNEIYDFIPICTVNYSRNSNTCQTTKLLEEMYNMGNMPMSLSAYENAVFQNCMDQMNKKTEITPLLSTELPDNSEYVYEHPNQKLGNAILYSQYTDNFSFTKSMTRKHTFAGGKILRNETPFEFSIESPFTADRDSYPIITDHLP